MRVRSVLMRAQKRKALRGKFISNDEKTTRPLKRLQKNKEGENTKFSHLAIPPKDEEKILQTFCGT